MATGHTDSYPDLLDVGVEELVAGLERGAWTSMQLTKVRRDARIWISMLMHPGIHSSWKAHCHTVGKLQVIQQH
jgi:hypothetical protein